LQLQDSRRTMNVHAHQHDALPVLLDQPPRELCSRGCFARSLQTGQKYDHRLLCPQVERHRFISEQRHQLAVDDLDMSLTRDQALADLLTYLPLIDSFDE